MTIWNCSVRDASGATLMHHLRAEAGTPWKLRGGAFSTLVQTPLPIGAIAPIRSPDGEVAEWSKAHPC